MQTWAGARLPSRAIMGLWRSRLKSGAEPESRHENDGQRLASHDGSASKQLSGWIYPRRRIAFLIFAAWLIRYAAGHWDRGTGAARFETTAFVAGDVTLSARVSGYITGMPVNDFQADRFLALPDRSS